MKLRHRLTQILVKRVTARGGEILIIHRRAAGVTYRALGGMGARKPGDAGQRGGKIIVWGENMLISGGDGGGWGMPGQPGAVVTALQRAR